jgi:hypothetical protein
MLKSKKKLNQLRNLNKEKLALIEARELLKSEINKRRRKIYNSFNPKLKQIQKRLEEINFTQNEVLK